MQSRIRPIPLSDDYPQRAPKFDNNFKTSDSHSYHYKEVTIEKGPLSQLVLRLSSQATTNPTKPQDSTLAQLKKIWRN